MIATLGNVSIEPASVIPAEVVELFSSVWAHRKYGGEPSLNPPQDATPKPGDIFFVIRGRTDQAMIGGVLVNEYSGVHRRAAFHAAIHPVAQRSGAAKSALMMAGAILCGSFGVERVYTYAIPGSPAHRLALSCGLREEGCLRGHILTPIGRSDIIMLGALWEDITREQASLLNQIEWEEPHGQ